jgi:hypothetical protein
MKTLKYRLLFKLAKFLPLASESNAELSSSFIIAEVPSCESPFSPFNGGISSYGLFDPLFSLCSPSGKRRLRFRSKFQVKFKLVDPYFHSRMNPAHVDDDFVLGL